jgi:hypothetical protein
VQLCSCSGLEFADIHRVPLMCAGNVAALNLGELQNHLGPGGTRMQLQNVAKMLQNVAFSSIFSTQQELEGF